MRTLPITTTFLLLGACVPSEEGYWTGGCETADHDLRVRVEVPRESSEERTLSANVDLQLHDAPGDVLSLQCAPPEMAGATARLRACSGDWMLADPEATPVAGTAFSLQGTLAGGDTTDTWTGTCRFDGTQGALELWRTPR